MPKRKKWFMLQVWRFQQVSQIATLILLSANLAAAVWDLMRNGSLKGTIFATSWVGIPSIMLIIAMSIWILAIVWDLRLKLWRDQATILVERNPYSMEKMSSKEILMYAITWLPVMDNLGKTDPKIKEAADSFRRWMGKITADDPTLLEDFQELKELLKIPSGLADVEHK